MSLTNTFRRDEEDFHSVREDPNDPFCVYNLFKLYVRHLPENWDGSLLRNGIPKNQRYKIQPRPDGFVPCARLDKMGHIGVNRCSEICKAIGKRCGMENAAKQLGSGRRRSGITQIANAKLPSGEVTIASRHKSWQMNAHYQIETGEIHKRRHDAQDYKVSSII